MRLGVMIAHRDGIYLRPVGGNFSYVEQELLALGIAKVGVMCYGCWLANPCGTIALAVMPDGALYSIANNCHR
jgi:hypothetical protein